LKGYPAISTTSVSSRKVATHIAELASDKKADDIVILDMRKIVNFCDYFVICSGNTDRQVRAIADHIEVSLKVEGMRSHGSNRLKHYDWVVLDTGDVVTHVFQRERREFYQLEYLWQEAKIVEWKK